MDLLFSVCFIFEMLAANFVTVDLCCRRRFSRGKTLLLLIFYLFIFSFLSLMLAALSPNYGKGSGLFSLVGLFYVYPLRAVYDEPAERLLTVVCSSWIYTMFLFSLMTQIGRLLPLTDFSPLALLIQTLLYLVTFIPFLLFIKHRFLYVLRQLPGQESHILRNASLLWYASVICINLTYVYDNIWLHIVTLVFLFFSALFTYQTVYTVVRGQKQNKALYKMAYTDALTGLANRPCFFDDIEKMIAAQKSFSIIYMDLDSFKSINDAFGHQAGDEYLKQFAETCAGLCGHARLYRMSGDEFIFVTETAEAETVARKIKSLHWQTAAGAAFLGTSLGCASFPADGTTAEALLSRADAAMYRQKESACQSGAAARN